MKKIISFEKYVPGQTILPNVMYTGKEFAVNGQYDFEIYGKGKINGMPSSGRTRGIGNIFIELSTNASVVFWKVPLVKSHPDLGEGLPPVPDYMDDHERNIRDIVKSVMLSVGIRVPESDSTEPDLDDDDEYDDDYDDHDDWNEDSFSLVKLPERTENVSVVASDSEARSEAESGEDSGEDDQSEPEASSASM